MDRRIVIIGSEAFKVSLIKSELSILCNVSVEIITIEELISENEIQDVSLIMLDYLSLDAVDNVDFLLRNLGIDILLFSAPEVGIEDRVIKWRNIKGILPHTAPIEHLKKSVQLILDGGMWISRPCLEKMLGHYQTPGVLSEENQLRFTKREKQILSHIANGKSNQQIASELFLAESTIKTHIYKLYKKLNVHSRHDALEQIKQGDLKNTK